MGKLLSLSRHQCEAILDLGDGNLDGSFDPSILFELFSMGIIEVYDDEPRVMLTEQGQQVFQQLVELEE